MNFSDNGSAKFNFENHVLNIFFESMDVSLSKSKRKIRKRPNILNGKYYVGNRKIRLSQKSERVRFSLQRHLMEEFYSFLSFANGIAFD